jgi:hypothetical protein
MSLVRLSKMIVAGDSRSVDSSIFEHSSVSLGMAMAGGIDGPANVAISVPRYDLPEPIIGALM